MKVAVYTANFGDKEAFTPIVVNNNVDYIYFTDKDINLDVWQVVKTERFFVDPRLESRFYFDRSIRTLPDYDITVMHGANAQLAIDPLELIESFLKSDIAAFKHPHRNCIYKEAEGCKRMSKDNPETIDTQIQHYREIGFPENYGLHACGLLIRRNTQAVNEFEELWWKEVVNGSFRDQLSFDYIRWKTGIEVSDIPGSIFNNLYMRVNRHNR